MTKVLDRQHCCSARSASLQLSHGKEDLLDGFYGAWSVSGFLAAHLVGSGRDHPDTRDLVVGRLSQ